MNRNSALILVSAGVVLVAGCARPTVPPRVLSPPPSSAATVSAVYDATVTALSANDDDRKAIVEALRVTVQDDLGRSIWLDARSVNRLRSYAYASANARNPDGSNVDYKSIPKYRDWVETGAFESGIDALLRKDGDSWRVLAWELGPTDVRWVPWAEKYHLPERLFTKEP